jgi:S1-C subfamily serine protease
MHARTWALAVSGLLLVAQVGCAPCGLPVASLARRVPTTLPAGPEPTVAPVIPGQGSVGADQEQLLVSLYKRANPAVVNVRVTKRSESALRFEPQEGQTPPNDYVIGQGSGFVVDDQGHIVTNHHVVEGAQEVLVIYSNGEQSRASVVGLDPDGDIAVIKVENKPEGIIPLELGNSDQVQVGQMALAIGNPFGLAGTLTTGIVSAVGRTLPLGRLSTSVGGRFSIPRMIQTDAAINPGNSGGPLLDSHGRVIGINTAINAVEGVNSGVGFAVPVSLVERVVPELIKQGHYDYPWLGISGRDVSPDVVEGMKLPIHRGALVVDVIKGSPAEQTGLRASTSSVTVRDTEVQVGGDIITAIDSVPVNQFDDVLVYLIEKTSVGQTVQLTFWRDGQTQTVPLKLVQRPQD